MAAFRLTGAALEDAARQLDGERRALSLARTLGVDGAAVQLDDVPDDREAEPEPAVRPRDAAVGLAEAIEEERAELRGEPRTRVADGDLDVRVHALEDHLHASVPRREPDRVREQVPHDLLQPVGIADDEPRLRIERRL